MSHVGDPGLAATPGRHAAQTASSPSKTTAWSSATHEKLAEYSRSRTAAASTPPSGSVAVKLTFVAAVVRSSSPSISSDVSRPARLSKRKLSTLSALVSRCGSADGRTGVVPS